eukprot:gb/GEZN01010909.1/.p1 GENE.gb/GEZN01010909.1/~~gb/GEZN01010909.1/.p1  ORF type:complete len:111 (+),score=18.18 gb/GEZN01010909.1/:514-846(+)
MPKTEKQARKSSTKWNFVEGLAMVALCMVLFGLGPILLFPESWDHWRREVLPTLVPDRFAANFQRSPSIIRKPWPIGTEHRDVAIALFAPHALPTSFNHHSYSTLDDGGI